MSRQWSRLSRGDSLNSMSSSPHGQAPVSPLFTAHKCFVTKADDLSLFKYYDVDCRRDIDPNNFGQDRTERLIARYPTIHASVYLAGPEAPALDLEELMRLTTEENRAYILVFWSVIRTIRNARQLLEKNKVEESSGQLAEHLNRMFNENALTEFRGTEDVLARDKTFVRISNGDIHFVAPEIVRATYMGQRTRETGAVISVCNPCTRSMSNLFYPDSDLPITLPMYVEQREKLRGDIADKLVLLRHDLLKLKKGGGGDGGSDDDEGGEAGDEALDEDGGGGEGQNRRKKTKARRFDIDRLMGRRECLPNNWQTVTDDDPATTDAEVIVHQARRDAFDAMMRLAMLIVATPATVHVEDILVNGGTFFAMPDFSLKYMNEIAVETLRRDYNHPSQLPKMKKKGITPDIGLCMPLFRHASGFQDAQSHRQTYGDNIQFVAYAAVPGAEDRRHKGIAARMGNAPLGDGPPVVVCVRNLFSLDTAVRVLTRMFETCKPQGLKGEMLDEDGLRASLTGQVNVRQAIINAKTSRHVIEALNLPVVEDDEEYDQEELDAIEDSRSAFRQRPVKFKPFDLTRLPVSRCSRRRMAHEISSETGSIAVRMALLLEGVDPAQAEAKAREIDRQIEADEKTKGLVGFVPVCTTDALFVVDIPNIESINKLHDSYAVVTFPWNCLRKNGVLVTSEVDLRSHFSFGFTKPLDAQSASREQSIIDSITKIAAEYSHMPRLARIETTVARILATCANANPKSVSDDVRMMVAEVYRVFGLSKSTQDGIAWFKNGFFGTGSSVSELALDAATRIGADRCGMVATAQRLMTMLWWSMFCAIGEQDNPIIIAVGVAGIGKTTFCGMAEAMAPIIAGTIIHSATDNSLVYHPQVVLRVSGIFDDVDMKKLGQGSSNVNDNTMQAIGKLLDGTLVSPQGDGVKRNTSVVPQRASTQMNKKNDGRGSEVVEFAGVLVKSFRGAGPWVFTNTPPFGGDAGVASRLFAIFITGFVLLELLLGQFYCKKAAEKISTSSQGTVTRRLVVDPTRDLSTLAVLAKILLRAGVFAPIPSTFFLSRLVDRIRRRFLAIRSAPTRSAPRPEDGDDITLDIRAAHASALRTGNGRSDPIAEVVDVASHVFGRHTEFTISTRRNADRRGYAVIDSRSAVTDHTGRMFQAMFFTNSACATDRITHVVAMADLMPPSLDVSLDLHSFCTLEAVGTASEFLMALILSWATFHQRQIRRIGNYIHLVKFFAVPEEGSTASTGIPFRLSVLVKRVEELRLLAHYRLQSDVVAVMFREAMDTLVNGSEPGLVMSILATADTPHNVDLRVHVAVLNVRNIWRTMITRDLTCSRVITIPSPFFCTTKTMAKFNREFLVIPPALSPLVGSRPAAGPGRIIAVSSTVEWVLNTLVGAANLQEAIAVYDTMVAALHPPGADGAPSHCAEWLVPRQQRAIEIGEIKIPDDTGLTRIINAWRTPGCDHAAIAAAFGDAGVFNLSLARSQSFLVRAFDAQVAMTILFEALRQQEEKVRRKYHLESGAVRSRPLLVEDQIRKLLPRSSTDWLLKPDTKRSPFNDIRNWVRSGTSTFSATTLLEKTGILLDHRLPLVDRLSAGMHLYCGIGDMVDRGFTPRLSADNLIEELDNGVGTRFSGDETSFCIAHIDLIGSVKQHVIGLDASRRLDFLQAVFDRPSSNRNASLINLVRGADAQGLSEDEKAEFARRVVAFRLSFGICDSVTTEESKALQTSLTSLASVEAAFVAAVANPTLTPDEPADTQRWFVSAHGPLRRCATIGSKTALDGAPASAVLSLRLHENLVSFRERNELVSGSDDIFHQAYYRLPENGEAGPVSWLDRFRLLCPENPDPLRSCADPKYLEDMRQLLDVVLLASVFVSSTIGHHPKDVQPVKYEPPHLPAGKTVNRERFVYSRNPDVCLVDPAAPSDQVVGNTMIIHTLVFPIGEAEFQVVTKSALIEAMCALWVNLANFFICMSRRNDIFPVCFHSICLSLAHLGVEHGLPLAELLGQRVRPTIQPAEIKALHEEIHALVNEQVEAHFGTDESGAVWAAAGFYHYVQRPVSTGISVEDPAKLAETWRLYHAENKAEAEAEQEPVMPAIAPLGLDDEEEEDEMMQAQPVPRSSRPARQISDEGLDEFMDM